MSVSDSASSLKISMGSVSSNPISDQEELTIKRKRFLFITLICTTSDFIIIILILTKDCNFYTSGDEKEKSTPNVKNFILFTILAFLFFLIILILLLIRKPFFSKICRYIYLIAGIAYYIYQIVTKIIDFYGNNFELGSNDIIFFFLASIVIVPRIIGFTFVRLYEKILHKIEQVKRAEDHENFLEKIVNKVDRGSKVNNVKASVCEKELDQSQNDGNDEEEVVFTMNDNKVITDNKGNVLGDVENKVKWKKMIFIFLYSYKNDYVDYLDNNLYLIFLLD